MRPTRVLGASYDFILAATVGAAVGWGARVFASASSPTTGGVRMRLEIDVDAWARALGPAVILMAYFDTNNARDWNRWDELVADDATHTANVDTSGLSVRPLKEMVRGGITEAMPDARVEVKNVYSHSPSVAFAEWRRPAACEPAPATRTRASSSSS